MKKYTVALTHDERENLLALSSKGSHRSQKVEALAKIIDFCESL